MPSNLSRNAFHFSSSEKAPAAARSAIFRLRPLLLSSEGIWPLAANAPIAPTESAIVAQSSLCFWKSAKSDHSASPSPAIEWPAQPRYSSLISAGISSIWNFLSVFLAALFIGLAAIRPKNSVTPPNPTFSNGLASLDATLPSPYSRPPPINSVAFSMSWEVNPCKTAPTAPSPPSKA